MTGNETLIEFLDAKINQVRDSLSTDINNLSVKVDAYLVQPKECRDYFDCHYVRKTIFNITMIVVTGAFIVVFSLMSNLHGKNAVADNLPGAITDGLTAH